MTAQTQRFRVLITDRFDNDAESFLRSQKSLEIRKSQDAEPSAHDLEWTQGLILRSRTKLNAEILNRSPNLKVAVTCTSGFDHVDFVACAARDIKLMYTPEANAASACELTIGLMIAAARKLPLAWRSVKSGDWSREHLVGLELSGRTLGIIGLGRIGTRVAKVAQAFGMRVLAFDPYKEAEYFAAVDVERTSLDEIFRMVDIISCHVPATSETHHMIKPLVLEGDTRGLLFVNTSRGSVISEKLLCEALDQGVFAACALDVFEREPLQRHSPLLTRDNVVLSPHIGAATQSAFKAGSWEAAEKIKAFVLNGAISDPIPPNELWMQASFRDPSTL